MDLINCTKVLLNKQDHNETSIDYCSSWSLEQVVSFVVPIFFGIVAICGLIGNALVILVVAANQQMRSTTNLLIINLAAADILFVIFCIPFTAVDYMFEKWPFGAFVCKFVQYMICVTCHASIYTLVLMSFDRFLAVVHPVSSMSLRTERNALIAIICLWLIITTSSLPAGAWYNIIDSNCQFPRDHELFKAFHVTFFLSSYMIPLFLISLLYVGMLLRLWKGPPGCKPSVEARKGKRRVTRMVVIVVLVFAICWLPIQIILVLKAIAPYEPSLTTVAIQIIAHVLAYTNSCVNPFLYAFLSENFRKAFRKLTYRSGDSRSSTHAANSETLLDHL